MKIKVLTYLMAVLLIGAVVYSADAVTVSKLHLTPQAGETVLKIDASGPFQYVHETAEAKDGKPFRVVVDLFPAVHELSQRDFTDLPQTIVSSIRTSQYSTNPENVVRIVCDLDQTVMYRIEKKGNSVFLYLPDQKSGNFAAWTSPDKAPVTLAKADPVPDEKPVKKVVIKKPASEPSQPVAQVDEPVKKVVIKKQANEPVRKVVVTKPADNKPTAEEKPEMVLAKPFQTEMSDSVDREKHMASQPAKPQVSKPTSQPVSENKVVAEQPKSEPVKPVAQKVEEPKKAPAKKAESKTEVTQKPVPQTKDEAAPKQEYTIVKKSAPAENEEAWAEKESKPENKAAKAAVENNDEADSDEMASADMDNAKDADQKPTSRFRRKPAFPNKLKGTIVAEFPKRIVMKYQPGTSRDPFENLLVTEKNTNDPIQKRIPDVETSKLVGVLESTDGQMRALLEDHDGYGYILKSGDKIKKGYVGQIYADKAYFRLFEYGWSRTVALYMNQN